METMQEIMTTFFSGVWSLFSSFTVPGFGIPLAKVAIGFFVIRFSLSLLSLITGFRSNSGYAADQFRTSSESLNQYKKVSDQNMKREKNGGIGFHG
ncbi:hypothetical protein [Intestinimonas massiliensis (ex Afouda et al. 2020)]|uniref:hypothetical protein n=1 Tax=Intestinimonas massiliensis (ex Afouda et al. 2020) TaxID=1673721 RepID=UPI0010310C9C|nr:hypothetical protein [Intestinimonas massiliensis (ex Afouda et al. 2020)]